MPNFNFYIDQKVTIWERAHYSVKAETEEEAKQIMLKEFEDPEYDLAKIFRENEVLFDTEETLTPEQNGGEPTKELFFRNESIKTNID